MVIRIGIEVCPQCKNKNTTILEKEPMTFKVNPNVIVQFVEVNRCTNCGFESISEKEYEEVRKLVHEVKAPSSSTVVLNRDLINHQKQKIKY